MRTALHAILAETSRPLSAADLGKRVAVLHPGTYLSNVFRTLSGMLADGEVERVELLSGYVLPRREPTVDLVCRGCGSYRAAAGAPAAALVALALEWDFQATRVIAEVKGRCPACADD